MSKQITEISTTTFLLKSSFLRPRKNYEDTNRKFIHFSFAYPNFIFPFRFLNFQTRWWTHNNLYTNQLHTFWIVNKFLKESFVGLSLPRTAFFIYFRSVLTWIVEVNNVLSSKPDAGEGERRVCVQHYQLWLIAILESCDPFMLQCIQSKWSSCSRLLTFLCGYLKQFNGHIFFIRLETRKSFLSAKINKWALAQLK